MRATYCRIFAVIAAVAALTFSASVQAAEWMVVKTFGQAWVQTSGIQKTSISQGRNIAGGATIVTGSNGKVFLARGRDSIIVSANSIIRLNTGSESGGWTIITQDKGSASYAVNRRNVPHFGVRTPTIAAVVKGTRFKVVENGSLSKVWVSEGIVQVSVHRTGAVVDIKAGQSAVLERQHGSQLNVVGPGIQSPIERNASLLLPSELTRTLSGATSTVGSLTDKAVTTTTSATGQVTADVGRTVSDIGGAVGGTAAGSVAGGAVSTVGSTVSSVGDKVGGALSGLGGRLR